MEPAIRIRMYRTGFGDCFLLTLGSGVKASHVLIDFGSHMHGDVGTMDAIMNDIEAVTAHRIAVLVATHAHRDHISGFGKFADRFAELQIREVWLPWTDNPDDKDMATIEKKHGALYETLEQHLRVALAATEDDPRYSAALFALSNLRGNEKAKSELRRGFGVGAKVRYLGAGDKLAKVAGVPGLSAEFLGPPRDKSFFSRMDPPAYQRFFTAPGESTGAIHPFPSFEVPVAEVEGLTPQASDKDIAALERFAEAPAGLLALVLNAVRNNTSLVIAFRYRGRTLLFPGDAQWGNWQSWIGTEEAKRLLAEVDFLKIAHHGSDNATPVDVVHGLGQEMAAMVSTQVQPYNTIPRIPLLEEIEKHCSGHVAVRSDWVAVEDAPSDPHGARRLPKEFAMGPLWIDYVVGNSGI